MKKQLKYVIILIVTAGFYMSCNDDFLEEYPLVSISDGNYWNTANDLKIYANRFYNYISSGDNQILFFPLYQDWTLGPYGLDADLGSDTQIAIDYNRRLNGETVVPASGSGWAISDWSTLRSLNYFMANYEKVTESWDLCKQYVGEILFFRTMFYFDKLIKFGDVPYSSTLLYNDSPLLFESRTPRDQLVDSLMRDMDIAVDYLPERTSTWTGRLTKETAMLLQARIALYEGTWEKYHEIKNTPFKVNGSNGSRFIQKAAEVSGALMSLAESNGRTGLANVGVKDGYNLLFKQKDYSANPEVLFWRKFEAGVIFSRIAGQLATGGGRGLTKKMVDSYLCIDGKPIGVSPLYQGDKDLKTIVINRDPRMNQTICVNDSMHIEYYQWGTYFDHPRFVSETSGDRAPTGYQLYKGHEGDRDEAQGLAASCGLIYFRYAEALLIYAEARAELNLINQNDIDRTINALRERAEMPPEAMLNMNNIIQDPNNIEFPSLSPLINEIRRERKIELACEGFRRDDIYRWAVADELIKGYLPKGAVWEQWRDYPSLIDGFDDAWSILPVDEEGYICVYKNYPAVANTGYNFNLDRDYLQPLPTQELTLNQNLKQNPGW